MALGDIVNEEKDEKKTNKQKDREETDSRLKDQRPDNPHSEEYRDYIPGYDDTECPFCGEVAHRSKDPADDTIHGVWRCINEDCDHSVVTPSDLHKYGSKEKAKEHIKSLTFLNQFDERNGKYRGQDPPKKSDQIPIGPETEYWEEEWVDHTGNFKMGKEDTKYTECVCGSVPWSGPRARYIRCSRCSRVLVDLEWEDDRFGNPRMKDETKLQDYL